MREDYGANIGKIVLAMDAGLPGYDMIKHGRQFRGGDDCLRFLFVFGYLIQFRYNSDSFQRCPGDTLQAEER